MSIYNPDTKKFYCECGCGTEIPFWSTWARGHYPRTEEIRDKQSMAKLYQVFSEEHRKNLSEAKLRSYREDPTYADRISEARTGTFHSEETKGKMSESHLQSFRDDPTLVDRISESHYGMVYDKERNSKVSKGLIQANIDDPTIGDRISEGLTGRFISMETIRRNSEAGKASWEGLSPEGKQAKLFALWSGLHRRATRTESALNEKLQVSFPGEWKYVGDGQVRIGGRNPDFISTNGSKAIIELFGSYWHELPEIEGRERSEAGTVEHYGKYGYECLVVWIDYPEDLIIEWDAIEEWIRALK